MKSEKVEEIFQSALDHPTEKRAAYLDQACADDAELRREVDSMISSYERAGSFIERPALEVDAQVLAGEPTESLVGRSIGHYKILEKIGSGGMGEVYLAEDARLGRRVALKLLSPYLVRDQEGVRRFQQEARAASSLNHPNVLTVYDTGAHDGSPYVVSELLEGGTLRERLNGNALSQRKAVDYALQIARGLAAAHERNIVHRDIKPENIFVTNDGRVKILDFGIAKLTEKRDGSAAMESPPSGFVQTRPGVVMGTAGYMSPEQVRGAKTDHRSDIFSFGAVLYEMLTGRRAFRGDSPVETLNAILKEDAPDLRTASPEILYSLERAVLRCLEKNPSERFQSASDLAFALEGLSGIPGSNATVSGATQTFETNAASSPILGRRSKTKESLVWVLTAVALALALALAALFLQRVDAPPVRAIHTSVLLATEPPPNSMSAMSPDGNLLTYVAPKDGTQVLWLRAIEAAEARPLVGTEGAEFPFWSPDSRSIGFFAGGKLNRIEAAGGPVQVICDAAIGRGGTWNRDGVILFTPNTREPVYRVPAQGGAPAPVTEFDPSKHVTHRWPHFLPDGLHFLFLSRTEGDEAEKVTGIYLGSLASREARLLVSNASNAVYSPPGYLLFVREGNLFAQPFDVARLQTTADAVPLAQGIHFTRAWDVADFSVSETGVLVYRPETQRQTQLTWLDRGGKPLGAVGNPAYQLAPVLSPDGQKAMVFRTGPFSGEGDLWLLETSRDSVSRFTFTPGNYTPTVWSPDGRSVVYGTNQRFGPSQLYLKPASGAGAEQELFKSSDYKTPNDWSADGRFLLYSVIDPKTGWDISALPLTGERKPVSVVATPFVENNARFSPDGRWVAYQSNETGRVEVYVRSFQGPAEKRQVSNGGGALPRWRRDGREIYYWSPTHLMAVAVKTDPAFEIGAATPLFEFTRSGQRGYDVSADGNRFLANVPVGEKPPPSLTLVLNWTASLKQ